MWQLVWIEEVQICVVGPWNISFGLFSLPFRWMTFLGPRRMIELPSRDVETMCSCLNELLYLDVIFSRNYKIDIYKNIDDTMYQFQINKEELVMELKNRQFSRNVSSLWYQVCNACLIEVVDSSMETIDMCGGQQLSKDKGYDLVL